MREVGSETVEREKGGGGGRVTSGLTCKVAPSDALTMNTTVFVKRCHQNYINLVSKTGWVPNCKITGKNTDESLLSGL